MTTYGTSATTANGCPRNSYWTGQYAIAPAIGKESANRATITLTAFPIRSDATVNSPSTCRFLVSFFRSPNGASISINANTSHNSHVATRNNSHIAKVPLMSRYNAAYRRLYSVPCHIKTASRKTSGTCCRNFYVCLLGLAENGLTDKRNRISNSL